MSTVDLLWCVAIAIAVWLVLAHIVAAVWAAL